MALPTPESTPRRRLSKRGQVDAVPSSMTRSPASTGKTGGKAGSTASRTPVSTPPSLLARHRSSPTVAVTSSPTVGHVESSSRPPSVIFPSAGAGETDDFGTLRTSLRSRLDSDASARARRTSGASFDEDTMSRARAGSTGSASGSGTVRPPNKLRRKQRPGHQLPLPARPGEDGMAAVGRPPSPNASMLSHTTFDADTSTEDTIAEAATPSSDGVATPGAPQIAVAHKPPRRAASSSSLREDADQRGSVVASLITLPITLPIRLASSVPLFGRLVPECIRPNPLFSKQDADVLGLPVRIAQSAFDLSLSIAVFSLFWLGGKLSRQPRANMSH